MTGAPRRRARSSIASAAPDQSAPPPARMIGRSAPARISAACAIASSGTAGLGRGGKRRRIGRRRALARASGPEGGTAPPGGDGPRSSPGTPCPATPGSARRRRTVPHQCGHRPEDPLEVDLVVIAALAIQRVGVDLAREQEDRHRVGPAFGDPGQRVGRAGAGGRADDARLGPSPARSHPRRRHRPARCGSGSCGSSPTGRSRHRSSSSASPASRTDARTPTSQSLDQYVRPVVHVPAPLKSYRQLISVSG